MFLTECDGSGKNAKDCKKRTVTNSTDHCCYTTISLNIMGVKESDKGCDEITKDEYNDIKKYINEVKGVLEEYGATDIKFTVDCSSSYLILSILGLIIFLI